MDSNNNNNDISWGMLQNHYNELNQQYNNRFSFTIKFNINKYLKLYYKYELMLNNNFLFDRNDEDYIYFQTKTKDIKNNKSLYDDITKRIIDKWREDNKNNIYLDYNHYHECKSDCMNKNNDSNIMNDDQIIHSKKIYNSNNNNKIQRFNTQNTSNIINISNTFPIFICKRNAYFIHVCNQSDCKYILRDRNGIEVCIMSGYAIGSVVHNEHAFKKTQVSKDDYNTNIDNENDNDYYSQDENDTTNFGNVEYHEDGIINLEHTYNNNNRNNRPNKRIKLRNDSLLLINNNNQYHNNNNNNISIDKINDIPIIHKEYTKSDTNNENSNNDDDIDSKNIDLSKKNRKMRLLNNLYQKEIIFFANTKSIIYDLLFNKHKRKQIDEQHLVECTKLTLQKVKQIYIKSIRNGKIPLSTVCDNIINNNILVATRLMTLSYDDFTVCFYANIIATIWKLIYCSQIDSEETKEYIKINKFHFKQFVVGILYMMKYDIIVSYYNKDINNNSNISNNTNDTNILRNSTDKNVSTKVIYDSKNTNINMIVFDDNNHNHNNIEYNNDSNSDVSQNSNNDNNNNSIINKEDILLFSKDDFLNENLPNESDLQKINYSIKGDKTYEKSDVSKGAKWINKSLMLIKNKSKIIQCKNNIQAIIDDYNSKKPIKI
jgi:hypothetical protein